MAAASNAKSILERFLCWFTYLRRLPAKPTEEQTVNSLASLSAPFGLLLDSGT